MTLLVSLMNSMPMSLMSFLEVLLNFVSDFCNLLTKSHGCQIALVPAFFTNLIFGYGVFSFDGSELAILICDFFFISLLKSRPISLEKVSGIYFISSLVTFVIS